MAIDSNDGEGIGANRGQYRAHLDTLVALVGYLATMRRLSRTPPPIARTLGLDEAEVRFVLENFKALFRKSRNTDANGEHYYTLHIRYGLRSQDEETDDVAREPLPPENISHLLEFVTRMAEQENTTEIALRSIRTAERRTHISMICAVVAAAAAIVAAVIGT